MIWKEEQNDSGWLYALFSPINRFLFILFSFLPFLFFFFLERKFIKVCVLEGELSGRSWGGEIIWTKYKIKIKDYLLLTASIVGSEFPSSSSSSESRKSLFSWVGREVRFVIMPGKCLKLTNNTLLRTFSVFMSCQWPSGRNGEWLIGTITEDIQWLK